MPPALFVRRSPVLVRRLTRSRIAEKAPCQRRFWEGVLGTVSPIMTAQPNRALEPGRRLGQAAAMDPSPARLFPPVVLRLGRPAPAGDHCYLLEENRVLRAANGSRRLCLTDDQRRRLAVAPSSPRGNSYVPRSYDRAKPTQRWNAKGFSRASPLA